MASRRHVAKRVANKAKRTAKVGRPSTPKQRAAQLKWQAAGVAARKAKGALHPASPKKVARRDELVTLYHATSKANAKRIMAEGFKWIPGKSRQFFQEDPRTPGMFERYPNMHRPPLMLARPIWFSKKAPNKLSSPKEWVAEKFDPWESGEEAKQWRHPTILTVDVPKRLLRPDFDVAEEGSDVTIPSVTVSVAALRGRHIRVWAKQNRGYHYRRRQVTNFTFDTTPTGFVKGVKYVTKTVRVRVYD